MFIAMNRFKVAKDCCGAFEEQWTTREIHLHKVPGFVAFHLLRGPEHDDYWLYASHTIWASHDAFVAWTKSESFRKAHANAGDSSSRKNYLGPPEFEGFDVVQEVRQDGTSTVTRSADKVA